MNRTDSALVPSLGTLAKLASIVVHLDESLSEEMHHYDWTALRVLLDDDEVQQWIGTVRKMGLVPVKRG